MIGLIVSLVIFFGLMLAAIAGTFSPNLAGLIFGWLCVAPFAGWAVGWNIHKVLGNKRLALIESDSPVGTRSTRSRVSTSYEKQLQRENG